MNATKQKQQSKEDFFFNEIYKNAKMGADSIINLLPHVKEDSLRSVMTMQLDGELHEMDEAVISIIPGGVSARY